MNNPGKKFCLVRVVGSLDRDGDGRGGGEKWLDRNNI